MSQRLIDSDALKAFIKNLEVTNGPGNLVPGAVYAIEVMFPKFIDEQPTIVPESLPIVRELREQLEHKDHLLRIAQREIKEFEPVHAHWCDTNQTLETSDKFCSSCGCDSQIFSYNYRFYKYCPNCGAIMDEEVQ